MAHQKKIKISEFKAKCLELVEILPKEGLVLTKRGIPMARVLPYEDKCDIMDFYGCAKDLKVKGDTLSTGVKWNAES